MLFQDDSRMKHFTAALKEKKLLHNFFKRLKPNETGRYMEEFSYISLCESVILYGVWTGLLYSLTLKSYSIEERSNGVYFTTG